MKLTILMVCLSLMTSLGGVYSQNSNLSFKVSNKSLKEVLSEIENQTKYSFLYKADAINHDQRVSIDITDAGIIDILDMLAQKAGFKYKILDNSVIVLTNPAESVIQQFLTISGRVTDSSGTSLPGVTVVIKGTGKGAISDANGTYNLSNVPSDATLQFSFVGMRTLEVKVEGQILINVILKEETVGIEEVVAIGYGIQKKSSLSGSISSVKSEDINKLPTQRVDQALQGRAAGVMVMNTDGAPGGNTIIRIRGNNSITGSNSALVVVDGIQGVNINTINPKDIESVEVLKDASATAIYGSRGANGVVLITTRRGLEGRPTLNYSMSYGIQKLGN